MIIEYSRKELSNMLSSEPFTAGSIAPFVLTRFIARFVYGADNCSFTDIDMKTREETRKAVGELLKDYPKAIRGYEALIGGGVHVFIFSEGLVPEPYDKSYILGIIAGGIFPNESLRTEQATRIIAVPIEQGECENVIRFLRDCRWTSIANSSYFDEEMLPGIRKSLEDIEERMTEAGLPLYPCQVEATKFDGLVYFPVPATCENYKEWFSSQAVEFLKWHNSKW